MNWAPVVYSTVTTLPWALVDPRGLVLSVGTHPSVLRAVSHILNRALHMAVEVDGYVCPLLVEHRLTLPNGQFTDAGIEWLANSERPNEQPN